MVGRVRLAGLDLGSAAATQDLCTLLQQLFKLQ